MLYLTGEGNPGHAATSSTRLFLVTVIHCTTGHCATFLRGSRHYFLCICHWICSEQHTREVKNTGSGCLRCAVSVPTVLPIRRSSHHRGVSSRTGPAPHDICRRSRVKNRCTGTILGSQTTNHQVYCLKAGKPRAV
jgi:hypothetical protein